MISLKSLPYVMKVMQIKLWMAGTFLSIGRSSDEKTGRRIIATISASTVFLIALAYALNEAALSALDYSWLERWTVTRSPWPEALASGLFALMLFGSAWFCVRWLRPVFIVPVFLIFYLFSLILYDQVHALQWGIPNSLLSERTLFFFFYFSPFGVTAGARFFLPLVVVTIIPKNSWVQMRKCGLATMISACVPYCAIKALFAWTHEGLPLLWLGRVVPWLWTGIVAFAVASVLVPCLRHVLVRRTL